MNSQTTTIRPIDAFVKYFLDVKPYHTKLLEVIERYKFSETVNVQIEEAVFTTASYINKPLCRQVGWGLVFDECGFSNDSCCDLFQCLGGYGIIWDNSELVASYPITGLDLVADEILIDGDLTFDRRLEILQVRDNAVVLKGDQSNYFLSHRLFLIAPFNVYSILSFTSKTLTLSGNLANELLTKQEFRISGTRGLDGMFGVSDAVYDQLQDHTVLTIAGNRVLSGTLAGGYIETETQARNQGFYQVKDVVVEFGNTVVTLRDGTHFPAPSTSNNGSLQLRTGLMAPRHVWLRDSQPGGDVMIEYRVADEYYNITTNKTHVVLAEFLARDDMEFNPTEARIYGYMNAAGFDGDEECDRPKPTNIHTVFGENLRITIVEPGLPPTPTPTPTPSPTPIDPVVYFSMLVTDYEPSGGGG